MEDKIIDTIKDIGNKLNEEYLRAGTKSKRRRILYELFAFEVLCEEEFGIENKHLWFVDEELLPDNKQYFDGYKKLLPELDKSNMAINVCNLVFILGYFIIIPVVNNGQTLGKKILKIKIEKIDGNLTIRDMVIRNFITTSLLQLMISSTLVYIVNNDIYYNLSIFVSLLQILLVIITSFMIIYRKDEKGVQDLITGTQVIEV